MPFAEWLCGVAGSHCLDLRFLREKLRAEECDLDQVAVNVLQRKMRLLDTRCNVGRYDDNMIAQRWHPAAVSPAESDGCDAQFAAQRERFQYVR